ncbi:26S proteasome non-ATPase regulatory subunit 14 [Quillaja saponaria]|uniref:26S proteasome non-ATPase regulatory subunit 14 n=1 Tax=Quillaja saponaria TaxID=32244 RepID=A0AAD7KWQ2_QUISA|nr:26S proteasome non-ATPase regulatory subunit 14 [Quillaja saponaria]
MAGIERFQRMFAGAGGTLGHPPPESPTLDTSEHVYISSLASSRCLNMSGTGVSVEAVDHLFQTNMLDMLKQTGRAEMVVGRHHSHPGFGCWLSGVDISTQQTTSNLGHLNKPSIQALIHGLNRHYYSIAINYRKNELKEKMLLNLHKKNGLMV